MKGDSPRDAGDRRPKRPPSGKQAIPNAAKPAGSKGSRAADPGGHDIGQQIVDKIEGKLTESAERHQQAAERLAKKADRHRRKAEQSARKAAVIEGVAEHVSALDIWTRTEPRARRPRFTRDEIATAAVRIADEEGFEALSMRRLAAELGAGTMTLYHYVRTKDELLSLVTDAVMGEVVLGSDEDLPRDWRAALSVIAHRSLASLRRHPWILDITDDPPFGPNSVRHFDQSLRAVATLAVPLFDRLDVVSAVDEYVFGYALLERNNTQPGEADTFSPGMVSYVNGLIETGGYPELAALVDEHGLDDVWHTISDHVRDPDRFDRNLARLLEGIAASLPHP